MEVAGWGGRLLWGFVYSEDDCWRHLGEGAAEKVDTFSGAGPFCVALVRLRSYVIMDGVLGWTQRQAKVLAALRPAKEKSKVVFRLTVAMQFVVHGITLSYYRLERGATFYGLCLCGKNAGDVSMLVVPEM